MASSINQEKAPTTNSNLLGQERDKSETTQPWFYKYFFSIGFWKVSCNEHLWRRQTDEGHLSCCLKRMYDIILKSLSIIFRNLWLLLESKIIILIEKKLKWSMLKYLVFEKSLAGFCWFGILKCTSIFGTDASQGSGKEFQNQHQNKLKICKKMDVYEYVHQW